VISCNDSDGHQLTIASLDGVGFLKMYDTGTQTYETATTLGYKFAYEISFDDNTGFADSPGTSVNGGGPTNPANLPGSGAPRHASTTPLVIQFQTPTTPTVTWTYSMNIFYSQANIIRLFQTDGNKLYRDVVEVKIETL